VLLHHTSLLAAGTAAALSLFDWAVFHVERGLEWTRPKAALHVWLLGTGLLVPSLLPSVMQWMDKWGSGFLLPLSALMLALGVGWNMPVSAQRQIFGRGFLLDRLFLIWRFSLRFLIPAFLGYLLFTTLQ
jgi:SNF family Na+-dependent transporter